MSNDHDQAQETPEQRALRLIREAVEDAGGPAWVTLETLTRDLNLDSIDELELVLELEDAFGVELADTEVSAAGTVGELVFRVTCGGPGAAGRTVTEPAG